MATITKRGDTYRIRVSCGYDINGKQLTKSTTWDPEPGMTKKQIEKELQRQTVLFEEKCRTGQFLDGSIKFAEFAEQWFRDYAEKQLRAKTVSRYQHLMKRINDAIGHMRLDRIQPQHLLSFYDNLSEAGIRNDTKYECKVDFKKVLKKMGLTKVALANNAEVSISVLNRITTGQPINQVSVDRIVKALEVKKADIFKPVESVSTLSPKTIQHHHRLISAILATAVEWQIIFSNPCDRVRAPKVPRTEAKYLDEEDAAKLLDLLDKEDLQHAVMIKLLIYTGMRRGELCGLEWQDIDFDSAVIHIRRTSLYLKGKGIFEDETKSATSARSIKVPQAAIDMLKSYRTYQSEKKLSLGDQWANTGRLFTSWNGNPIHPDTITGWFRKFIVKNNLPDISVHSLRHTNATLLIAGGVPIKTVSNRLGHAQASTTSNIYAHAIRSADEAAAETLQDILHPTKKKSV